MMMLAGYIGFSLSSVCIAGEVVHLMKIMVNDCESFSEQKQHSSVQLGDTQ